MKYLFGVRRKKLAFGKKRKPASGRPKPTSKKTSTAIRGVKIIPTNSSRPYHYARLTGKNYRPYITTDKSGKQTRHVTYTRKYYPAGKAPSGKVKTKHHYKSIGNGLYIQIGGVGFFGRKKVAFGKKKAAAKLGLSRSFSGVLSGTKGMSVTFTTGSGKKVTKKLKKVKKNMHTFKIKARRGGSIFKVTGALKKGKKVRIVLYRKLR